MVSNGFAIAVAAGPGPDASGWASGWASRGASGWRAESVCRTRPTHWWFGGDPRETLLAKSICSGCPVKGPCLEFALSRPDICGIWAATTVTERTTMRRDSRAAGSSTVERPGERTGGGAAAPPAGAAEVAATKVAESKVALAKVAASTVAASKVALAKVGVVMPPGRKWCAADADLLTPAEAARKLGVTPNTVTRWSRAGKISALQTMGGHRRFRRDEIDRVLRDSGLAAATTI
jgi:excisionase family DNA binding protein